MTESEREYLINGKLESNSEYAESKKKSEIKARVRNGFHDLMLIQKYGDEDLNTRILNEDNRQEAIGKNPELLVNSMTRFMSELTAGEEFTNALYRGMKQAEYEGWSEQLFNGLEAAARGDQKAAFQNVIEAMSDIMNLPKDDARRMFNQNWR